MEFNLENIHTNIFGGSVEGYIIAFGIPFVIIIVLWTIHTHKKIRHLVKEVEKDLVFQEKYVNADFSNKNDSMGFFDQTGTQRSFIIVLCTDQKIITRPYNSVSDYDLDIDYSQIVKATVLRQRFVGTAFIILSFLTKSANVRYNLLLDMRKSEEFVQTLVAKNVEIERIDKAVL